jgi:Lantibiotic dehydratase, N terminus
MAVEGTTAVAISDVAEHMLALPDPDWGLWRTIGLRGAGFPAAGVLDLGDAAACDAADRWTSHANRPRELPPDVSAEIDAGYERGTGVLRRIVRSARFREAVTWQNREVLQSFDHVLLTESGRRSNVERGQELRVASYWQRYSVKNDMIGYFGPFGWARIEDAGDTITARPGSDLLSRRQAFFEGWAIESLGEIIAADPRLRPWLAPRRLPFVHLEGCQLHRLYSPPLLLTPGEAAVLAASNGELAAKEVAAVVRRDRSTGLMTDAEVYRVIEGLRGRGLLGWGIELPSTLMPEEELRRALERVGDETLRSWALSGLEELERGRSRVAAAAGDAEALGREMEDIDATFTRLTGHLASRAHGQTYGGRRIVYEDCCRDLDLTVGPRLVAELAAPLSLLLTSARWVTHELAATYRAAFRDAYRAQAARSGSAAVDLAQLPFLSLLDMTGARAAPVVQEAAERWGAILAVPETARFVQRSAAELERAVREAFSAPGPGWPLARYHSPDLMVDGSSLEAIQEGKFQLVLGELHVAVNALLVASTVAQHHRPHNLQRWVETDLPDPQVVNVVPKRWERVTTRTYPFLRSPKDFYLALAPDPGAHPPGRGLAVSALVLEEVGGELIAHTRDGALSFDVVELFGLLLAGMLLNRFRLHPPRRHLPRIRIDRVVVCRESWTLPATELTFAGLKDEAARFAGARLWARRLELPRFAFLRTPLEMKPVYVDFASPIYVSLLCRLVRAVQEQLPEASVTLAEMLPDPLHAWLPDAEGNRYTCEFRVVAFDRRGT